MNNPLEKIASRRSCLGGLGLGGAALLGTSGPAYAERSAYRDTSATRPKAVKPLRSDSIAVALVQPSAGSPDLAALLEGVTDRIVLLESSGSTPDLVHLGALVAGAQLPWSAKDAVATAIDLDGMEIARLQKLAAQQRCYLSFECLARDRSWAGHIIHMGVLIGSDGAIAGQQWRAFPSAKRDKRLWAPTTIADVRERFIGRYGDDAMVPVIQTDIGNISMLADASEPLLQAAQAIKGTELMLFSALERRGGSRGAAEAYQFFTIGQTRSSHSGDATLSEAGEERPSLALYDPRGVDVSSPRGDGTVSLARLPLARWRQKRCMPDQGILALAPVLRHYSQGVG